LVDSVESMMMHRLANPKLTDVVCHFPLCVWLAEWTMLVQ